MPFLTFRPVRTFSLLVSLTLCLLGLTRTSWSVTLEQIVSHEDPALDIAAGRLVVGRDGKLYISHSRTRSDDNAYLLMINPDGSAKSGHRIHYINSGVAVATDGTYMVAENHFAGSATIYNAEGAVGSFKEFENSNYDAPQHVEVGASNDFYAADQRGGRIVRINAKGQKVAAYPMPKPADFRVCEATSTFYLPKDGITCFDFDGEVRWNIPTPGPFDVTDDGTLYLLQGASVQKFGPDGKPIGEIALKLPEVTPARPRAVDLRIFGNDIFIKRESPTEIFASFDLTTGEPKRSFSLEHDRLSANFDKDIWIAGEAIPFKVAFATTSEGGPAASPHWRLWARAWGAPVWRELPIANDSLTVPADLAGLYEIKLTPETRANQGHVLSEYALRSMIEVRAKDAQGSASVLTPNNRVFYGRGEAIPLRVIVRGPLGDQMRNDIPLRVMRGQLIVLEQKTDTGGKLNFPAEMTASWEPGEYSIVPVIANFTCVAQPIVIGPGMSPSPFLLMQYGDYGPGEPFPESTRAADAFGVSRSIRLGVNMYAERINSVGLPFKDDALVERLTKDLVAVAPEKAILDSAFLQVMAQRSAYGMYEMPILLGNDAVLPMGETVPGIGITDPAKTAEIIKAVTEGLQSYPNFRGWIWAANWWVWTQHGSAAATSPEQKKAYEDAVKDANDTGKWAPVLQEVSDRFLGFAAEATEHFGKSLRALPSDKPTATAAPYRNAYAWPPITFKNVDQVDLHFQAEQMTVPYFAPHDVDFYKRPGKPAWGHPEIWNDNGTGDQIVPTLFQMIMRGADGVGFSGQLPPSWAPVSTDERSGEAGVASVYRALFDTLRPYGPWLTTLQNNDNIAIIASGRMFRLDVWSSVWGQHFARVKEAYASCLHAHHPASIVFVEDLKPDTLSKYKAVLLVDQRYEMEPELVTALNNAKAAGTNVFYDGMCREELVKDFTPLGISFNLFETDHHTWGDDPAYAPVRFPGYVMSHVPALKKALDAIVPPVAETDNPEILLSERTSGDAKFLFVSNNTTPNLDPGQMYRFALFVSTRVPLVAPIRMQVPSGGAVYDLFARKQVELENGNVNADLRSISARIFAILPKAIAKVELVGPKNSKSGDTISWTVSVQDPAGQAIRSTIPVRVRLLDSAGQIASTEQYASPDAAGAKGTFTIPSVRSAGQFMLEATELFSGKTARTEIHLGSDLQARVPKSADPAPEERFGPHLRDAILIDNGSTAVLNAMNWNENLYAVDVETGSLKWQKRAGHVFAFAPRSLNSGFAVQGVDLDSTQGYHLYLADSAGKLERRFAMYGLARRRPSRFFTGQNDRMNQFAVAPDGGWVASYGDLGLVMYARDGKVLWKTETTKATEPHFQLGGGYLETPTLAALGADALLIVDGPNAIARSAKDGAELWRLKLANVGRPQKVMVSDDAKTIVVFLDTNGGLIVVVRDGKIVRSMAAVGTDIAMSGDASRFVVIRSNELKFYTADQGLKWVFPAEDYLINPRLAPDGRIAVANFMGVMYVLDGAGQVLLERDMKALAVPTWLPNGDLLLATWMGGVYRLGADYRERWHTLLAPESLDMRDKLLASDGAPTARVDGWTTSAKDPAPITPNLLTTVQTKLTLGLANQPKPAPESLTDGKPDAPALALGDWGQLNWVGESWAPSWLEIDGLRTRLRVTGITFFEDSAHPESWQRDAQLQYWDPAKEQWTFVQTMLSDSAVHTHMLDKPVEAARFRILFTPGMAGNLRLGEIVLHGEAAGPANADAAAKKPVATLFDETEDPIKSLIHENNGLSFAVGDAYSGIKALLLKGNAYADPLSVEPLGAVVPSWDFEMVEKPEPGQYRYLQLAWKPRDAGSTQVTVHLNDVEVYTARADGAAPAEATAKEELEGAPDAAAREAQRLGTWQVVRVDLWDKFKKPVRIQSLRLTTKDGAALFDQILLGRSEDDLKKLKSN